jgi:hypothetical protein
MRLAKAAARGHPAANPAYTEADRRCITGALSGAAQRGTFVMKIPLASLFAAVLAGCHTAASYDIKSSGYRIPPGSSLIVNKELSIPSGQRHVKLQHGQPVGGVDDFKINCQIWVYDLGVASIRPDSFRITSAGEGREWELQPTVLRFFRVLHLRSEAQREVLKLICQKSDDPLAGRNPTVAQMQEALGEYITFEFATSPQQSR